MTKELKQDLWLSKVIISRCSDLFETESFHNNRRIPTLFALAYEELHHHECGIRTQAASKFGFSCYDAYRRSVDNLG